MSDLNKHTFVELLLGVPKKVWVILVFFIGLALLISVVVIASRLQILKYHGTELEFKQKLTHIQQAIDTNTKMTSTGVLSSSKAQLTTLKAMRFVLVDSNRKDKLQNGDNGVVNINTANILEKIDQTVDIVEDNTKQMEFLRDEQSIWEFSENRGMTRKGEYGKTFKEGKFISEIFVFTDNVPFEHDENNFFKRSINLLFITADDIQQEAYDHNQMDLYDFSVKLMTSISKMADFIRINKIGSIQYINKRKEAREKAIEQGNTPIANKPIIEGK